MVIHGAATGIAPAADIHRTTESLYNTGQYYVVGRFVSGHPDRTIRERFARGGVRVYARVRSRDRCTFYDDLVAPGSARSRFARDRFRHRPVQTCS